MAPPESFVREGAVQEGIPQISVNTCGLPAARHRGTSMAATIWRGRLVFGLVSIPVRLHKAARRERVQFHNVYPMANASAAPKAASAAARGPDPGAQSNVHQFPS